MPYPTNASLPPAVKDKIKSPKRRRQWRHVWNSEYERHGDESRAFASAWAAVKKGQGISDAQTHSLPFSSSNTDTQIVFPPWLRLSKGPGT